MFKKFIKREIDKYINERFQEMIKREFRIYGKVEFVNYKYDRNLNYTEIFIAGKRVLPYTWSNVFMNVLYFDGYKKLIYLNLKKKNIIKEIPEYFEKEK